MYELLLFRLWAFYQECMYAVKNKQVHNNVNIMLRQKKGGTIDGKQMMTHSKKPLNEYIGLFSVAYQNLTGRAW